MLTIGTYGVLTADEARKIAKVHLGAIAQGADPVEAKKAERGAMTVKELCDEYIERAAQGLILTKKGKAKAASTLDTDKGKIARHIVPLLGKRAVKDVTPADVQRAMRDIIAGKTAANVKTEKSRAIVKGGNGAASRAIGLLGGIFTYAKSEGYVAINPVHGVTRPADNVKNWRLDDAGFRALGTALAAAEQVGAPWQFLAVVRICALTGARLGEIEGLKRSEADLPGKALRLDSTKTGGSIRPIGSVVVALLRDAMNLGNSPFVFPGIQTAAHHRATTRWLKKTAETACPGITSHGFRHSFASVANDLGFALPTIKALLGHAAPGGVTGGYIHHLDNALIAAADKVSRHIDTLMQQTAAPAARRHRRRHE